MAEDELLRKIDRTLERNSDAFERNRDAFKRNTDAFKRNTDAFERMLTTLDRVDERLDRDEQREREQREWLDAHTERHVAITQELISSIQNGSAQLQAEIADQRAQIKANTDALLRVLDRLGPSPQNG